MLDNSFNIVNNITIQKNRIHPWYKLCETAKFKLNKYSNFQNNVETPFLWWFDTAWLYHCMSDHVRYWETITISKYTRNTIDSCSTILIYL